MVAKRIGTVVATASTAHTAAWWARAISSTQARFSRLPRSGSSPNSSRSTSHTIAWSPSHSTMCTPEPWIARTSERASASRPRETATRYRPDAPIRSALPVRAAALELLHACPELAVLLGELLRGGVEHGIVAPPVDAHLLGLVHRHHQQPDLHREQLDLEQVHADVTGDDDPLVQDPLQDVGQPLRLRASHSAVRRSGAPGLHG